MSTGGGWDTGKVPLNICPDPGAHAIPTIQTPGRRFIHVHVGQWCQACVEHGATKAPAEPSSSYPPCRSDLVCCRNDGHEGDHLYPNLSNVSASAGTSDEA